MDETIVFTRRFCDGMYVTSREAFAEPSKSFGWRTPLCLRTAGVTGVDPRNVPEERECYCFDNVTTKALD